MTQIRLELFPRGYWDKHIPTGAELQSLEIEPDGTIVGYGFPNDKHSCDEMGCSSIRHVLFILEGQGNKT